MSSSSQDAVAAFARVAALAALISLSACGGGGDSSSVPPPPPPPPPAAPTLAASAAASATTAGGQPVALDAVVTNSSGTVTWTLTGPGSLSASSGANVNYVPPAPDTVSAGTQATVTATLGSLTQTLTLNVGTAPGNTWEMTTVPSLENYGALYANGGYVVVGAYGEVLRSSDGVAWTSLRSGTENDLRAVAYGAPGYVAVGLGGTLVFSADGNTWQVVPQPQNANGAVDLTSVVYADGRYLALGNFGNFTSTDGVTWTSSSLEGCDTPSGPAVGGTRIVVACGGAVFYSDDGLSWTTVSLPGFNGFQAAYGNGRFVAYNGRQAITSPDGVTWSAPVTMPSSPDYQPKLRFVNGSFFVVDERAAYQSSDGVTWTTLSHTFSNFLFDIAPGPSGGALVVGSGGLIQTSPDLATWADVGPAPRGPWGPVVWNNGVYATVDINQVIWTSPDGRAWTAVTLTNPNTQGSITTVSAANGLFLATGTNTVMTSPDGVTWTNHPVPQNNYFGVATWANGLWVVVCEDSDSIYTSPDLQTWTAAYTDGLGETPGDVGIAYGQGRFVALQMDGTFVTSTDGVSWTPGSQPTVAGGAGAIGIGANGFVALGGGGGMYHSADGMTWTSTTLDVNFSSVAYGNGRYVAVGDNGEIVTSTDGIQWTPQSLATDVPLESVAYGTGSFVLVGLNGVTAVSTH